MNIRINMTHVNDTIHSNCIMLAGLLHNYSAHNFLNEFSLLKFKVQITEKKKKR